MNNYFLINLKFFFIFNDVFSNIKLMISFYYKNNKAKQKNMVVNKFSLEDL